MHDLAIRARRARDGDLVVFFANGLALASWTSRVPDVRATLHLTPGRLALLLLAVSAGAVVGLPLAGRVATGSAPPGPSGSRPSSRRPGSC